MADAVSCYAVSSCFNGFAVFETQNFASVQMASRLSAFSPSSLSAYFSIKISLTKFLVSVRPFVSTEAFPIL